jgi:hypothetical protein
MNPTTEQPLLSSILEIHDLSSDTGDLFVGSSWLRHERIDLIVSQELIAQLLQGWDTADPFAVAQHRKNARAAVMAALAGGVLLRPTECSRCGEKETERVGAFTAAGEPAINRIEAHHDDYSKPLEVQWLCSRCHVHADRARRLRDGQRPVGDDFAAFLLVNGAVELPFKYDPPEDYGTNGDYVECAIRLFQFAGFDTIKRFPWITAVLSCGHEILMYPSELSKLRTTSLCQPCTHAKRLARQRRAERARLARITKRAMPPVSREGGGIL